jgi:hypothetical protein
MSAVFSADHISDRRDYVFSFAVILLLLLPVVLIQREMYDGVPVGYAIQTQDYLGLKGWLFGQSWYLTYWFYWLIGQLSSALGVHYIVLVKACLVAIYCGHYVHLRGIANEVFYLDRQRAHAVGLLACIFPSLQIFATTLGVVIPLYVLLGVWGYRWLHASGVWRPLCAMPLIVAGFQLNSMVPVLFGLAICRALLEWSRTGRVSRRNTALGATILALAVAFFVLRKILVPPSGIYASYNPIQLPTSLDGIKTSLRALAMFLTWLVIPIAAFLATVGVLVATGKYQFSRSSLKFTRQQWMMALAVSILWCSAIAPYVLVGKGPPLLTPTAMGSGITEQAIRAFYAGWPIAPTFSVTSGRHAIATMLPISLMVSGAVWLACHLFCRDAAWPNLRKMLPLLLVLAFILPWGGAWTRLKQQHAQIALVNGLKTLPAPPAGVVEIQYSPVSDWLMHQGDGNLIARQAWGSWAYMAFVFSLENYRKEMHWGYNAGFKDLGGLKLPWLQKTIPVSGFPGERCISSYSAQLPDASVVGILLAGFRPQSVKAATVVQLASLCADGQTIPNPMPERAASY